MVAPGLGVSWPNQGRFRRKLCSPKPRYSFARPPTLGRRVTKHPNLIPNFESRHITTLGRQGPRKPFHPIYRQWKFLALFVQQAGVKHRTLGPDRKSTRLNSSHSQISYAVFCLKKKKKKKQTHIIYRILI